jgi:hypothetical protein
MSKKQVTIFIMIIALTAVISGCGKKVQVNQLIVNNSQVQNQEQESEDMQQEVRNYEIKSIGDGWVTFRSNKCNFEISYPERFKEFDYCGDVNSNIIFSAVNFFDKNDKRYSDMVNWKIGIELKRVKDKESDLESWIKKNIKIGKGHNESSGDTNSTLEIIKFLGQDAFIQTLEYNNPSEGPSGLWKNIYFQKNNKIYLISGQIVNKDSAQIELFLKIATTFNFLN